MQPQFSWMALRLVMGAIQLYEQQKTQINKYISNTTP